MIPIKELKEFKDLIKKERKKIPTSKSLVQKIINENPNLLKPIIDKVEISSVIEELRQKTYDSYLEEEDVFNKKIMKLLPQLCNTPNEILEKLINKNTLSLRDDELKVKIKEICGDYSGEISPFIYILNLSTTQSRRSRSGQTFESVIYSIYEKLGFSYDSQKKVGANVFKKNNLGKKVDSILPSVECFEQRRDKVIIGTMKTSLRERWQEVAEEISRTKVPSIYLLTTDTDISSNKASEMKEHNITVVVYDKVKKDLNNFRNLISFEEYFFEEIPNTFKYWKK
jgi:hypothetical protein